LGSLIPYAFYKQETHSTFQCLTPFLPFFPLYMYPPSLHMRIMCCTHPQTPDLKLGITNVMRLYCMSGFCRNDDICGVMHALFNSGRHPREVPRTTCVHRAVLAGLRANCGAAPLEVTAKDFFHTTANCIFSSIGMWVKIPHVAMEIVGMTSALPQQLHELPPNISLESLGKVGPQTCNLWVGSGREVF
jgi:hypothetical protein